MIWFIDLLMGGIYALVFVSLTRLAGRFQLPLLALTILACAVPYVALGLGAHPAGALGFEWFGLVLFCSLAALGIWASPWYLVAAWALHAPWDLALPAVTDTSYMPSWFAPICAGFDTVVTLYLVALIFGWLSAPGGSRTATAGAE